MTNAQRKRRAERIIDDYKINYSIPFWTAYRDKRHTELGRWSNRLSDFKRGLFAADPHARWYQRLNRVDIEVKKQVCPEEDDP